MAKLDEQKAKAEYLSLGRDERMLERVNALALIHLSNSKETIPNPALSRTMLSSLVEAPMSKLLPAMIYSVITFTTLLAAIFAMDSRIVVIGLVIFLATTVFLENLWDYPAVLSLRDAPPANLIFSAPMVLFLWLVVLAANQGDHSLFGSWFENLSKVSRYLFDFPYSPPRLVGSLLGPVDAAGHGIADMAHVAYALSLLPLILFVVLVWVHRWPRPHLTFNVWINFPWFDPVRFGDVEARLNKRSRRHLALGILAFTLAPLLLEALPEIWVEHLASEPILGLFLILLLSFGPIRIMYVGVAELRVAQLVEASRTGRTVEVGLLGELQIAIQHSRLFNHRS